MPTVTETIEAPDGTPLPNVDVTVRLIASASGEAPGYVTTTDVTVLGRWSTRTGADGVASLTLIANALINPANTVYEWTRKVYDRPAVTSYVSVPNGAGPYVLEDILTTAPTSLADPSSSAAINAHIADTTDAHDASTVSLVATSTINVTDVQSGFAALADQANYRDVLVNLAASDRQGALADQKVRYDDGTEVVIDTHAGAGDWTAYNAVDLQVSGGKLYSNWVSGHDNATARKTMAVATGARLLAQAIITVPGSGGVAGGSTGKMAMLILYTTAGGTGDLLAQQIGVGVNELHHPMAWTKAMDAQGSSTAAELSTTALAAGDWLVSIYVDEHNVCFSLKHTNVATSAIELKKAVSRDASPIAIAGFGALNQDSRGLTGLAVGPLYAKTLGTPPRASSNAKAKGSLITWPYPTGTVATTTRVRVAIPPTYDPRKPTPLILWCHGSGRTENDLGNSNTAALVQALTDTYGYIVGASNAHANNWGNQNSLDDVLALYRYCRDRWAIGPVVMMAASMGGLDALLTIAERRIPGIVGAYLMYGVTNLADVYNGASGSQFTSAIETAYGFSGSANYAAATAGHDPQLMSPDAFRGLYFRFSASLSDTAVFQTTNTDLMVAKLTGHAKEASLLQATGVHGDPSQTDIADVVSFLSRCVAA